MIERAAALGGSEQDEGRPRTSPQDATRLLPLGAHFRLDAVSRSRHA